jgi:hypothetical protein
MKNHEHSNNAHRSPRKPPRCFASGPEARGNSQTAGKLWCDPQQVSNDHDACRLDSQEFSDHAKRGDCPRCFLMLCRPAGPRENKGGHSTGALRPRQRVCRPSRPDNHFMKGRSLAVPSPKGWLNNVSTHQPDWGFLSAAYPGRRFALPWAISFCPFGADGSIDSQEFSDHATSN